MSWYRRKKAVGSSGTKSAAGIAKRAKKKQDANKKPVSTYSDFWLDDYMDTDLWGGVEEFKDDEEKEKHEHELGLAALVRLAGIKNSIGNFVQILTGKSIPVKFHDGSSSYTDGETVTLTGNVLNESFDVTVGLSLHEGSHILLTDFSGIKAKNDVMNWMKKIPLLDVNEGILERIYNAFGEKKSEVFKSFSPLVEKQISKHIETIIKWEYLLHGPIGLEEYIEDGWGIGSTWGRETALEIHKKYGTVSPNLKGLLKKDCILTKGYKEIRKNRDVSAALFARDVKDTTVGVGDSMKDNPTNPTKWKNDIWKSLFGSRLFRGNNVRYMKVNNRKTGMATKNKLSKQGMALKKFGFEFDEKLVDKLWKIHATASDKKNLTSVFKAHKEYGILNPLFYYIQASALMLTFHSIHNWVEDRRIDNYVYSTAPGYRGYYESLYNHYFLSEKVSKELKKNKGYRGETWSSYEFSLINILNKECKLDRLKGLRKIWETLDTKNITTWATSTEETDKKAEEIIYIIFNHIKKFKLNFEGVGDGSQNTKGNGGGLSEIVDGSDYSDGEGNEGGEAKKGTQRDFEKQRKFVLGDVKKTMLPEAVQKRVDQVGSFDASLQIVGREIDQMNRYDGEGTPRGVECVLVKKITPAVVESSGLSCFWGSGRDNQTIASGIKKGYILGRKLQIRNEERSTVFNRKKQGKIDKRLINELGFGNESIFNYEIIDKYKKTHLHLTIDNSGSMCGRKFENALECAVAVAKAGEMVSNIEVVISFRYSEELPILVIGYDSRIQKLSQATWGLSMIHPAGMTPEGLTFEVIADLIPTSSRELDVYFVNFSDGAPGYSAQGFYYGGDVAQRHTASQVKKLSERGVNIISYYIAGAYGWDGGIDWFKSMYGRFSEKIDVTNIFQVAKTLNARFLKRFK